MNEQRIFKQDTLRGLTPQPRAHRITSRFAQERVVTQTQVFCGVTLRSKLQVTGSSSQRSSKTFRRFNAAGPTIYNCVSCQGRPALELMLTNDGSKPIPPMNRIRPNWPCTTRSF
jgi:hypothetical protein